MKQTAFTLGIREERLLRFAGVESAEPQPEIMDAPKGPVDVAQMGNNSVDQATKDVDARKDAMKDLPQNVVDPGSITAEDEQHLRPDDPANPNFKPQAPADPRAPEPRKENPKPQENPKDAKPDASRDAKPDAPKEGSLRTRRIVDLDTKTLKRIESERRNEARSKPKEVNESPKDRYKRIKADEMRAREKTKYTEALMRAGDQWTTLENGKTDGTKNPFVYKAGVMDKANVLFAYSPNTGLQVMDYESGNWQVVKSMPPDEQKKYATINEEISGKHNEILKLDEEMDVKKFNDRLARNEKNHDMEEQCLKNPEADHSWFNTKGEAGGIEKGFWFGGNEDICDALKDPTEKKPLAPAAADKPATKPDKPADKSATPSKDDEPVSAIDPANKSADTPPAKPADAPANKPVEKPKNTERKEALRNEIDSLKKDLEQVDKEWKETIAQGYDTLKENGGLAKLDELAAKGKQLEEQIAAKEAELKALEAAEALPEKLDELIALRKELTDKFATLDRKSDERPKIQETLNNIDTKLSQIRESLVKEFTGLKRSDDERRVAITADLAKIDTVIKKPESSTDKTKADEESKDKKKDDEKANEDAKDLAKQVEKMKNGLVQSLKLKGTPLEGLIKNAARVEQAADGGYVVTVNVQQMQNAVTPSTMRRVFDAAKFVLPGITGNIVHGLDAFARKEQQDAKKIVDAMKSFGTATEDPRTKEIRITLKDKNVLGGLIGRLNRTT